MSNLNERSGKFTTSSNLVALVYELLRVHVRPGDVETITVHSEVFPTDPLDQKPLWSLSNGWLAAYPRDVMRRLILDDRERNALQFAKVVLLRLDPAELSDEDRAARTLAIMRLERFVNDV